MKDNADTKIVLERLRAICSKSEKCPKDVADKLKAWKYEGSYESVISILKEENFLNEERFASAFVNDKIKFSKWGKTKVRHHLKYKGISEHIIESSLESYPIESYLSVITAEMQKKNKSLKEVDRFKRKQKLLAFGAQRGYENEFLYQVLENFNTENPLI